MVVRSPGVQGGRLVVSSESGMSHPFSLTVQDGLSPLYAASQEGHTEVVDVLVKAGADVNQACTKVYEHISYF